MSLTFLHDSDVALTVQIAPEFGAIVGGLQDYKIKVTNQSGLMAFESAFVAPLSPSVISLSITVPAQYNTPDVDSDRFDTSSLMSSREILITYRDLSGNLSYQRTMYSLRALSMLAVLKNSFMTLAEANKIAVSAGCDSFLAMSTSAQESLLIQSYRKLIGFRYSINVDWRSQDYDNTLFSARDRSVRNSTIDFRYVDVNLFNSMPSYFTSALKRAQIVETNEAASSSSSGSSSGSSFDPREEGLILRKVGDSTDMYRSSKAMSVSSVSKKTAAIIAPFISMSSRIARG